MMPLPPILVSCVVAALLLRPVVASLQRPNPPTWPPSVRVFGPEDEPSHIEAIVDNAFKKNGGQKPTNHGEFSSLRFAFLFKPGNYKVDVPVGYYTQVLGLGGHPRDVIFDAPRGVFCEEGNDADRSGSLSTFWRSAENFHNRRGLLWATSQGAPLRRVMVGGNLTLAEWKKGTKLTRFAWSSNQYLVTSETLLEPRIEHSASRVIPSREKRADLHYRQGKWKGHGATTTPKLKAQA